MGRRKLIIDTPRWPHLTAIRPKAAPSPPPLAYDLRFPLDKGHWVEVRSNKPLTHEHFAKLATLLAMQEQCVADEPASLRSKAKEEE